MTLLYYMANFVTAWPVLVVVNTKTSVQCSTAQMSLHIIIGMLYSKTAKEVVGFVQTKYNNLYSYKHLKNISCASPILNINHS